MKAAAAVSKFGSLFCLSSLETFLQVQRIRSDPHSPTRYRVDGTVYNIPEFAQAFQCSSQAKVRDYFMDVHGGCQQLLLLAA